MDLIYKQEFYENALKIELEERGFEIKQQYSIKVIYKNKIVGDYIADLFIVGKIIIELKNVTEITGIYLI